jgi:hypothetical protein
MMMIMWFPYKAHGVVTITPSVEIEERYDTNFFNEGASQDPQGTFVTTVAPSLNLGYTRKYFSLDVYYGHNFRYISLDSEVLNDGMNRTSIALDVPVSERTSLSISDVFSYTEDQTTVGGLTGVEESQILPETGVQTERTKTFTNTFTLAMSHAFTPRTTTSLTLSDYRLTFLDSSLLDARRQSADLITNHQLTDKTSIEMTYAYTLFIFETIGGGERNTDTHSLSLGITELISPTFTFNVSGGVSYTPEFEDDYSAIGQAGFTKEFRQSSLTIDYSRELTNTSGLTDEIGVNDTLLARWDYPVGSTVDFTLFGTLSKYQSEPTGDVDTTSYTAGLDGGWRPYSWMSVGIGYSHTQQWADGTLGEDLSRDQVSVTITATPAGWSF